MQTLDFFDFFLILAFVNFKRYHLFRICLFNDAYNKISENPKPNTDMTVKNQKYNKTRSMNPSYARGGYRIL